MPMQILPRETNFGESFGTGLGAGLSQSMQDLANMKMKEYAQRQQSAQNEKFFNSLPGMTPEQAKAWAGAPIGLQQTGLKELMNQPRKTAFSQGLGLLAKPGQLSDVDMQKLQEALPQMNPEDQYKTIQLINQQRTNEIAAKNQAAKLENAKRESEIDFTKKIEPWLTKEDARASQINEMGTNAKHALDLLEEIGPKNYPGLLGRGLAEVSGGWLYPSVKELQNAVGELALSKASSLKGQPTNFKIRLVQSIKPGLSADYKSNVRMLRRYNDVQEALGNRQAFRDNLKANGQFPTNIESIMSEYDNAMNKPEKHKKFFEQYPQTKEDAHFLSREYELKKMKEENEKYGKKGPKKAVAPELKVGSTLDKLPPASEYPGMEGIWNGQKVKSDGNSWRKV